MLWEKIIPKKVLETKILCSIEVTYNANGFTCASIVLQNVKGQFSISGRAFASNEIVIPENARKKEIPIILTVTGKGVLVKECIDLETQTFAIPGTNLNEFYVQTYNSFGRKFHAFLRRPLIEQITHQIQPKNDIVQILISPLIIGTVGTLGYSNERVNTNSGLFGCTKENLLSKHEDAYSFVNLFNENQIAVSESIPYIAALAYVSNQINIFNDTQEFIDLRQSFDKKLKVRTFAAGLVLLLLILSLINMLVFNFLFGKQAQVNIELSEYETRYSKYITDENQHESQSRLLGENFNPDTDYSVKVNEIARLIPSDVNLYEIEFSPKLSKETYVDSLTRYENNRILIKGGCKSSLSVSEWIKKMEGLSFAKKIDLTRFSFLSEQSGPNFQIDFLCK